MALGVSASEFTVSGLTYNSDYDLKIVPHVTITSELILRGRTLEMPSRVLKTSNILMTTPQNGMYEGDEPAESGVDGIPVIGVSGRTICSNFNRITAVAYASQHTVYWIRFLLGNLSSNPISGGRLAVAYSNGWDGSWEPIVGGTKQNTVTGNMRTGWAHATINGDPTLPIGAAPNLASGKGVALVWTDWMPITPGQLLSLNGWDFYTRFWLPQRSVAPYALTLGNWETLLGNRFGTLAGRNAVRSAWRVNENAPIEYHVRAEGDFVTDPSTAGNIGTLGGACPASSPQKYYYGPPGPSQSPLLAVQYSTSEVP